MKRGSVLVGWALAKGRKLFPCFGLESDSVETERLDFVEGWSHKEGLVEVTRQR